MKLRDERKKDSVAILKELSLPSPARGTRMKKSRRLFFDKPSTLSADEALAMMIDASLSTHQYNVIREPANQVVSYIYPAYNAIKQAKKKILPFRYKSHRSND